MVKKEFVAKLGGTDVAGGRFHTAGTMLAGQVLAETVADEGGILINQSKRMAGSTAKPRKLETAEGDLRERHGELLSGGEKMKKGVWLGYIAAAMTGICNGVTIAVHIIKPLLEGWGILP